MNDETLPIESQSQAPISSYGPNVVADTLLKSGMMDPPLSPGTMGRIGRLEVLRFIGEGGMGQVFLARDPVTDTRVAVKIMKPALAGDPTSRHRFLVEARHMFRMSHANILRVLEVSDRKEGPYYVMPYVDRGSLQTLCKPDRPLSERQILPIAQQVAGALAYAHKNAIIHRDVKPGNVLVDREGSAFLTDFGLVRGAAEPSAAGPIAGLLHGTAPYMSPALARGEAEDTRCDIYAFGALLYELLTGQPPYSGRTAQIILNQIVQGPPRPIRDIRPTAPPALVRIAEACMARELRDRYATMPDVVADLDRAARDAPLRRRQPQWRRARGVAVAAAGVLATAGLGGLALRHAATRGVVTAPSVDLPAVAFAYTTNSGKVTVTGYAGREPTGRIPEALDGLPVAAIGDFAFAGATSLTNLAIPAGVTAIGVSPFSDGNALVQVSVDPMNPAFCSVAGVLFDKARGRLISFPGGRGGSYAVPSGVTNIAALAFRGARLSAVAIPASVTSIGGKENPFQSCRALTSMAVAPANPAFSSADGVLFDKARTTLIAFPSGRTGAYEVPVGVTRIGPSAFRACARLTRVDVPASIRDLGAHAFRGCEQLAEVRFQGDAPALGERLFNFSDGVTVCYRPGTRGWERTFAGRPTAAWGAPVTNADADTAAPGLAVRVDSPEPPVVAAGSAEIRVQSLCERSALRVATWNDARHLVVQAVLWGDDDQALGLSRDGEQIGDCSVLSLDLDGNGAATTNVDREYHLNPRPRMPGLRYTVFPSTTLQSDTQGRGGIRYGIKKNGQPVRVDTYVIPLDEIGEGPGKTVRVAFWASSPHPPLRSNSLGDADYDANQLPRKQFHAVSLAERAAAIDVQTVLEGPVDGVALVSPTRTDWISKVFFDPPLPATLALGEKLTMWVDYDLQSAESALIWFRPQARAGMPRGWSQAPPGTGSGSLRYAKGKGRARGWFTCTQPGAAVEIRVSMVPTDDHEDTLASEVMPMQARWTKTGSAPEDGASASAP